METRKPRSRWFYLVLLTGLWSLCAFSSWRFGGGENFNWLFFWAAGLWAHPLIGSAHHSGFLMAAASVVTVVALAFIMDRLHVRISTWRTSIGVVALLCFLVILYFYGQEAARTSLAAAANKFDLNRGDRLVAYPLFCLTGGVLLGSIAAAGITILGRLFNKAARS